MEIIQGFTPSETLNDLYCHCFNVCKGVYSLVEVLFWNFLGDSLLPSE